MFRLLLRIFGYAIVAAGFVGLMIDATRSLANSTISVTPLQDLAQMQFGERLAALQISIERQIHPLLWDPVLVDILRLPAAAAGLAIGFFLLWLGRIPAGKIGYLTRR